MLSAKNYSNNIQSGFILDDKNFKVSQSYVKTDQANGLIILNITIEGQEYYKFNNQTNCASAGAKKHIQLGRLGHPLEAARAIVFLATPLFVVHNW